MKMELMVLNFGGLSEEKRIKNQKKIERERRIESGFGDSGTTIWRGGPGEHVWGWVGSRITLFWPY